MSKSEQTITGDKFQDMLFDFLNSSRNSYLQLIGKNLTSKELIETTVRLIDFIEFVCGKKTRIE